MPRKLAVPLPPPTNTLSARIGNETIYMSSPKEDFERFLAHLERRLISPDPNQSASEIWRDFSLSLVVYSGYCSDSAFTDVIKLKVRDLVPLLSTPYLYAPRLNAAIPIGAPPMVRLAGIRLLASISARSECGRLPLHLPLANHILFPFKSEAEWLADLKSWFLETSFRLNLIKPLTPHLLLAHTQTRIAREHSGYVAGYLSGAHIPTLSFISETKNLLSDLRRPFELRAPKKLNTPPLLKVRTQKKAVSLTDHKLEEKLKHLLEATEEYRMARKGGHLKSTRERVRKRLKALSGADRGETSASATNTKLLASWLVKRISKPPNTLRSDQSMINSLLRHFPNQCVTELTYQEITGYLENFPTKSKERRASAVNQLRKHLVDDLGIKVSFPPIWHGENIEYRIVRLLCLVDIENLVRQARATCEPAAVSLLLGAFGGLRIEESFSLTLGNIYFETEQISVYIRNAKHRPYRWVTMVDLPETVHEHLRTYVNTRLTEENGNLQAKLISENIGKTVNQVCTDSFKNLGLQASHRDLRRFWINRLIARGWQLAAIGKLAGHRSLATTVASYSAIAPQLHHEELEQKRHDPVMRLGRLGVLLGFSNRAVRKEHARQEGIDLIERMYGNRHVYLIRVSDAVKLAGRSFK